MARKWLEGAAGLRRETVTKPFTKTPGKRADELISGSLYLSEYLRNNKMTMNRGPIVHARIGKGAAVSCNTASTDVITMLSIPQYLDFANTGKTKEICSFFLELLQRKSEVLYLHSQQVANYSASVAAKLGLSRKEIGIVRTAALLHDIGLLSVPNSIMYKFPYLSTRELAQYKRHCIAGCSMLENMEEFAGIIDLIRCHHEKWDGTGYPKRLKGVNIPLGARIIAVADYYDSVINPSYTQWQKSHQEALQELLSAMGTAFDPEIVKAFMEAVVPGNTLKPATVYAHKGSPKRKSKTAAERIMETPAKSMHMTEQAVPAVSDAPASLAAEETEIEKYKDAAES